MPLTAATKRCRRAYAANHIPWDGAIARLGADKMNELSEYWERKAGITEDVETTLRECVEVIRAVQPVPPNGTQGGRIVNTHSHRFHGSYRE